MKQNLYKEIFETLRSKGLVKNQREFYEKAGIGMSISSSMMTGVKPMSKETWDKLAAHLGVSRQWLSSDGEEGAMFTAGTPNKKINSSNGLDGLTKGDNLDVSQNKKQAEIRTDQLIAIIDRNSRLAETTAQVLEKFVEVLVKSEATNASLSETVKLLTLEGRGK